MFEGEKTSVFWAGLIVLGVSIYFFATAIWQMLYIYFLYPSIFGTGSTSGSASFLSTIRIEALASVPPVIGGIIFAIIGAYMMRMGVRKEQKSPKQTDQPQTTT